MAGLSVGMKCLKYTVVLLNLVAMVFALALIAVGSYVLVQFSEYSPSMQRTWQALPIIVIVLGCMVFLVGFLGCCGAYKENYCMIFMYATLVIFVLIAEIAAIVMAVIYKDHVETRLKELFTQGIADYDQNEEIAKIIDLIQEKFKCCGAESSNDYPLSMGVPKSCDKEYYNTGCVSRLGPFFQRQMIIIASVFAVKVSILLFIAICSCVLARQVRSYEPV